MRYELVIPIEPKPKARPRATVIAGHASVYTPKETRVFEAKIAAIAAEKIPKPLEGPVRIGLAFYMTRPKRLYRKKDPDGWIYNPSRPDLDNLEKAVTDGLQSIAYKDDSQIVEKVSSKRFHEKPNTGSVEEMYDKWNARPRIVIVVEEVGA